MGTMHSARHMWTQHLSCQSVRILKTPSKILVSGTFCNLLRQQHETDHHTGGCLLKSVQPRLWGHGIWNMIRAPQRACPAFSNSEITTTAELPSTPAPSNVRENVTQHNYPAKAMERRTGCKTYRFECVLQRHVYSPCEGKKDQIERSERGERQSESSWCVLTNLPTAHMRVGISLCYRHVMALAGRPLYLSKRHRKHGPVQGVPTHNALSTMCQAQTQLDDSCRCRTRRGWNLLTHLGNWVNFDFSWAFRWFR